MSTPIVRRLKDLPWQGWPAEQVPQRGSITILHAFAAADFDGIVYRF